MSNAGGQEVPGSRTPPTLGEVYRGLHQSKVLYRLQEAWRLVPNLSLTELLECGRQGPCDGWGDELLNLTDEELVTRVEEGAAQVRKAERETVRERQARQLDEAGQPITKGSIPPPPPPGEGPSISEGGQI